MTVRIYTPKTTEEEVCISRFILEIQGARRIEADENDLVVINKGKLSKQRVAP